MKSQELGKPGKFRQFCKVGWMTWWRCTVAITVADSNNLFLSMVLGFAAPIVLVLLLNHTVAIFPLVQLVRGRNPLPPIAKNEYEYGLSRPRGSGVQSTRSWSIKPYEPYPRASSTPRPHYVPGPEPALPMLDRATQHGRKTGFEPRELEALPLQRSPWITGDPGFGLSASGFDETSVRSGQQGEQNFAKALQKTGLINKFQSFWSAAVPDRSALIPSRTHSSDIDCILFNGHTVYLVDLKNYKGGDVTYKIINGNLRCVDNATGQRISISGKTGRNMEMALEITRAHLVGTGYNVEAAIVFMPTNSGAGRVDGVFWPGKIRAYNLDEFLQKLQAAPSFDTKRDHGRLSSNLANLVRQRRLGAS